MRWCELAREGTGYTVFYMVGTVHNNVTTEHVRLSIRLNVKFAEE